MNTVEFDSGTMPLKTQLLWMCEYLLTIRVVSLHFHLAWV